MLKTWTKIKNYIDFELNDGAIACAKFQKAARNPSKSRLASLKVHGQTDRWTDRVR